MTESSETVQREVEWVSPEWNEVFGEVIQRNIKYDSLAWNSLAYIQPVQPKITFTARRVVVQRNIKWHSVAWNGSAYIQTD